VPFAPDPPGRVTNIQWRKGKAYLIVTMHGNANQAGGPAPIPTFDVSGGDDSIKLIEVEDPVTTSTFTPGDPITEQFFFIWFNGAQFPDETTIGNRIGTGQPYGGQFSLIVNFNSGGFGVVRPPRANSETGFYVSFEDAAAGATFMNNAAAAVLATSIEWFSSVPGAPIQGPAGFSPFFADEVDVVTPAPGVGFATATQRFLLGPIPLGDSFFSASASRANQGNGCDAVLLFNVKGKVTSFDTIDGGQVAAEGSAGVTFGGDGAYSIAVFFDPTLDPSGDGSTNSTVDVKTGGGGGGTG